MYKILFCSKQYREAPKYLAKFLDKKKYIIESCKPDKLPLEIVDADVVVPLMTQLTPELINKAESLKMIHQFGVGLEGVDIEAATKNGIYVANIPADNTGNAYSVSELTLFFIFALLKNFKISQSMFKKRVIGYPVGDTILDKKFLILGYGNVGKAIADMLKKFQVEITIAKRLRNRENINIDNNISFIDIRNIRKYANQYDFIIAALSLNSETKNFINKEILLNMHKNSFFINVARGGVVKYEDLKYVLKNNIIKGAALDVYWHEPFDPEDEIFKYNVIATPHIAGSTSYSYDFMAKIMAKNIKQVLEKNLSPENMVNNLKGNI